MRKNANIKDVAALAGVSVSTVSNVLNGKGRVSDSRRTDIEAIAKQLGYQPAAAARNLRGKRSGILTMAVSTTSSSAQSLVGLDYFVSMIGAATTAAAELGYSLIFSSRELDANPVESQLGFDGFLIVDPIPGDPVVRDASANSIPLVTTGRSRDLPTGSWVDVDVRAGTRELLGHLSENGANSVALLTGPYPTSFGDDVRNVYEEWCRSKEVAPDIILAKSDLSEQAAFEATVERLRRVDQPDSILCTFERLAVGALMAASTVDLRVPDDLLIAACADANVMRNATPPITVLDLQPAEVARHAVNLLVDIIEGRQPESVQIKLPAILRVRKSTASQDIDAAI